MTDKSVLFVTSFLATWKVQAMTSNSASILKTDDMQEQKQNETGWQTMPSNSASMDQPTQTIINADAKLEKFSPWEKKERKEDFKETRPIA